MKIDILTLFPEMFRGPFDESIVKRAQNKKLVEIKIHNLRQWTEDKHQTVDDRPFGGGTGMILMIEPLVKAVEDLKTPDSKIILLSPRGTVWKQRLAKKYSSPKHLILICGHYEGVDERISNFVDEEISIGDFILTGGEIPTMVLIDSIVRLIPEVLEKQEATQKESFEPLLEFPQYTRPETFRGLKVPKILLSGNHQKIAEWRRKKAEELTKKLRPDLI